MKNSYHWMFSSIVGVGLVFSSCQTSVDSGKIEDPINKKNFNEKISPVDDFDEYVNGGWKKIHPIPSDRGRYGSFDVLSEKSENQIKELFNEIGSSENPSGSIKEKIATFYQLGMDSAKINQDGMTPLNDILTKLDKIKSKEDIEKAISSLHQLGIYPAFAFYVSPDAKKSNWEICQIYQGGLGMADRDYYTKEDARSQDIRNKYVKHIENMFVLMGDKNAEKNSKAVMNLEMRLAKASMTRVEQREPSSIYNKTDLDGLAKMASNIEWKEYFHRIGINDPKDINVGQPKFIKEVSDMLSEISVENWVTYLKWNVINSMANYLSDDFVNEHFAFYGETLSGLPEMRPRWKRVQGTVNNCLDEGVGQLYVAKYFPPESKERMKKLVENLRIALGQRIQQLEWMGDETKQKAIEKLNAINVKIGYPDVWKNYSNLAIQKDAYVLNVLRSQKFAFEYNRDKVNKKVDENQWFMPPQLVNAYYSPEMNEIVFPAAILQPPFFFSNSDDAVNYGAIGVVIGHEMTHGFDDQGRKYDKDGNLIDWWTKDDAMKFEKRASMLASQFDHFEVANGVFGNGKLTLGENIADLGGLNVAYQALQNVKKNDDKIGGFTPNQRFFIAYANVWAQNIREKEKVRLTKEDEHSLGKYRIIGPLRNLPQFYSAFGVKDGDKMFLKDEDRVKIW